MSATNPLHKQISPAGTHFSEAKKIAEANISRYSNDRDLGRSEDDWAKNVFQGAVAEIVAKQYFEDLGFDVQLIPDTDSQDFDLELEGLRTEVKLRRLWRYRSPDYLLRHDDVDDLDAELYVMVEADRAPSGTSYSVSKWASDDVVREYATGFRKNRPMVPRENLKDVSELVPVLRVFQD